MMRKGVIFILILVTLTVSSLSMRIRSNSLSTAASQLQPVNRWSSNNHSNNLYALNENDVGNGYNFEGVEFCTLKGHVLGSVPLLKVHDKKNGGYFYTTDSSEAKKDSYISEGHIGYVFNEAVSLGMPNELTNSNLDAVPLYHYYDTNTSNHFYSLEQNAAEEYTLKGVAAYVFKGQC